MHFLVIFVFLLVEHLFFLFGSYLDISKQEIMVNIYNSFQVCGHHLLLFLVFSFVKVVSCR